MSTVYLPNICFSSTYAEFRDLAGCQGSRTQPPHLWSSPPLTVALWFALMPWSEETAPAALSRDLPLDFTSQAMVREKQWKKNGQVEKLENSWKQHRFILKIVVPGSLQGTTYTLMRSGRTYNLVSECDKQGYIYTRVGKSKFIVVSMQNTSLFLYYYCVIFHVNHYKPAFAHICR